ncbi:hypothetical protein Moror_12234, partial [Moniliophthora roreri MCA 2997]
LPFILLDAPPATYGAWSPKQWHTLLALHNKTSGLGMVQAQQRKEVYGLLAESLKIMDVDIEGKAVEEHCFMWQGASVPIGHLSESAVMKEITCELYKLNFQFEFHALNSKLGHSTVQHNISVNDITMFEISV